MGEDAESTEETCVYEKCVRRVSDHDQCYWHREARSKSPRKGPAVNNEFPDNLIGAYLVDAKLENADLQNSDLTNASLRSAKLANAGLQNSNLTNANLNSADLTEANLRRAKLAGARLDGAQLVSAGLPLADLSNTDLRVAPLTDAVLFGADLTNADLGGADLTRAELRGADLTDTDLDNADLTEANLSKVDLARAQLSEADLTNADLEKTNFTDADLELATLKSTDLREAILSGVSAKQADMFEVDAKNATVETGDAPPDFEDAILENADLRGATFENARLYQTDLTNVRINAETTFDMEIDETSPDETIYERDSDLEGWFTETTETNAEAGAWVHRRLERLHEENALSERAREFHVRKQEAERTHHWRSADPLPENPTSLSEWRDWLTTPFPDDWRSPESWKQWLDDAGPNDLTSPRDWWEWLTGPPLVDSDRMGHLRRWGVLTLSGGLTRHGESLRRVAAWSVLVIVLSSLVYPFSGIEGSNGTTYRLTLGGSPSFDVLSTYWRSLYFSVITFSTIGYGNLAPHGFWSQLLVGIESLAGAVLVALFIFVLGRRTAR